MRVKSVRIADGKNALRSPERGIFSSITTGSSYSRVPLKNGQKGKTSTFYLSCAFVFSMTASMRVLGAGSTRCFKQFQSWISLRYFVCGWNKAQRYSSNISCAVNGQNKYIRLLGMSYQTDRMTNITPSIISKLDKKLHHVSDHPLKILKDKIHDYLHSVYRTRWSSPVFTMLDDISPVVTTHQNFDSLLVPTDHIARSQNDNYYINKDTLLRAHTTAHEIDLLKMGLDAWVLTGDVYRRDAIDRTHYPVFHQMEGVRVFVKHELFHNYQVSILKVVTKDRQQSCDNIFLKKSF